MSHVEDGAAAAVTLTWLEGARGLLRSHVEDARLEALELPLEEVQLVEGTSSRLRAGSSAGLG